MLPSYKVITSPTSYPIDVDETLKRHCNLSTTDTSEDALLLGYIKAATEEIERYIGYPLMAQTIEVKVPDPIKEEQELTGNVNGVNSYTYYDGTTDVVESGEAAEELVAKKYPILTYVGEEDYPWPTGGTNFRFNCAAGYTQLTCPESIKQACRLLVMAMYEDREGYKGMPETVMNILDYHILYL